MKGFMSSLFLLALGSLAADAAAQQGSIVETTLYSQAVPATGHQ